MWSVIRVPDGLPPKPLPGSDIGRAKGHTVRLGRGRFRSGPAEEDSQF